MTLNSPYDIPGVRRDSAAPLVAGVRAEVDRWREQDYVGASVTSRRLLEHWFLDEHQAADGIPFRYYFAQREAIETIIYLYEVARARTLAELVTNYATTPVAIAKQPYPRYVVKAATGSGKTKVMSLAIAWAYFHSLREQDSDLAATSLVVAPNLIVFERLREDFEGGRIFRSDPVIPPEWRVDFDLQVCLRDEPVPVGAPGVLALTNVQALYERPVVTNPNPVGALLGPRPPKNLRVGDPLLVQLARRGKILVVDDEAHHLHDEVRSDTGEPLVAIRTLQRLHEMARSQAPSGGVVAQLDFSATPRNQQGQIFPETIVDYPLAQAIEDGIVKRPVIGELSGEVEATSDDASIRYRQRLGAGVAKWREFRDALAPVGKKPLLFVMAEDTTAADQIARYLETLHDLAGKVLTIHVKMGGRDRGEISTGDLAIARDAARKVDSDDNPFAAIVSVLMLREGWDVKNVSVIVPLRAYTAKARILPEQTLGRGLRRMTPPDSGVDEQVVVIEHEAFRKLWDEALDAEGLAVERRRIDEVRLEAKVIAVDPDRLAYDIEIPQLSRVLFRETAALTSLRPEDVPARHIERVREARSETVDYTGRDLLTGEVIERSQYPLPTADDPTAVLAWYVHELQRDTRVTGQFALLAPLVKDYVETRAFGGTVDFDDPLTLQTLADPVAQEVILGALREAVDAVTLVNHKVGSEPKPLILSSVRPFLWSRDTANVAKSVFSLQPCDSGLEVQFCSFLDRCKDVTAFAKLAREARFSLEYRTEGGRLAYYYPDFVVRLSDGEHLVVETKGLADLDVPRKDERAIRWAVDATVISGTRWRYLRVDEEVFYDNQSRLTSMKSLVSLVYEVRRQAVFRSQPAPRRRTPEEILATMEDVSRRTSGLQGIDVDDEIRRMREELGG
ncbi:DEAD/DEAH box helicase family protein [Kribbella sp. NBC_01245]|uniref:DEAD/DEAH box helicase family protein n=1 Tax=Kribbella sp. NBC_01245 TaxID=2903578 RepID=UPI002E2C5047|nr:DEAD/DEAH box helicase family protein [Kribbella sp. NBC_01245]